MKAAQTACSAVSGKVASVHSELENSLVLSLLTAGDNLSNGWLGATDSLTEAPYYQSGSNIKILVFPYLPNIYPRRSY